MPQPDQPDQPIDTWTDSTAYDAYIGRWSRLVAPAFLAWLAIETNQHCLDIGSEWREHIHASLPLAADGSIALIARAWAVRGRR